MLVSKSDFYKDAAHYLVNVFDKPCGGVIMRQYLFSAFWQNQQIIQCKQNITKYQAIAVYNFVQNYCNIYQDAIKSFEYAKNHHPIPTNLHPIPTYYLNASFKNQQKYIFKLPYGMVGWVKLTIYLYMNTDMIYKCEYNIFVYKFVYELQRQLEDSKELDLTIAKDTFGSEHGKGESDGKNLL